MRLLGIDYGSKKIGVALSDERGEWAFPHSVVAHNEKAFDIISRIVKENDVREIVIGESRNFKGEANEILSSAVHLAQLFAAHGLIIHFEPEYLTSHQAQHIQGTNRMIDASAATIILQSFLDKRKNQDIIPK